MIHRRRAGPVKSGTRWRCRRSASRSPHRVQTANPANLGLHPGGGEAPRSLLIATGAVAGSLDERPRRRKVGVIDGGGRHRCVAGKQPRTLSLIWLKNHEVPADWDEQKRLFDERDAHS